MYKQGSANWNFFVIFLVIFGTYFVWRATGGVERGEARRAAGENGLFIEVKNVAPGFDNRSLFGTFGEETLNEVVEELEN